MENEIKDPIEEYYKSPRISNSLLKSLQNPRAAKLKKDNPELYEWNSPALRIGSAVDCLLTDPTSWEKRFKVLSINKPYGFMGSFVEALPEGIRVDSPAEDYEMAYWASGYKMSRDWVIKKFWSTPDAVEYYYTQSGPKDITVLSKDEHEAAIKATELILASPFAKPYFVKSGITEELLHQVPIYFELEGQEFKALLDGIRLNHKNRTIEPFDLKTTGKSVYDFPQSYLSFGYYTQAALYDLAIRTKESPVLQYIDEGYTIKDFVFIVAETKTSSTSPALIYTTTQHERNCGLEGGYVDGKYYKGIYQLLDDYLWYSKNDLWVYPKEIHENNGQIPLRVFAN